MMYDDDGGDDNDDDHVDGDDDDGGDDDDDSDRYVNDDYCLADNDFNYKVKIMCRYITLYFTIDTVISRLYPSSIIFYHHLSSIIIYRLL